ncbi:MAG TPA: rhomboid family intramembrane serine protease [Myxococcales bacterium]|jgi:membrane associated rhomboid family serine protease
MADKLEGGQAGAVREGLYIRIAWEYRAAISRGPRLIPIRDTIPHRNPPVVTWALIAANIAVFLYELTLGPDELQALFYMFGVVPARYSHPEWAEIIGLRVDNYWPFLTCMFLHGGWAHVIGNMWTLWIFGDNVEDRMGRVRFLLFYLLTGVVAGITHWFTNIDSTVPTVGASGAIAGVLGAYFVLFRESRIVVMFPVFFFPFFFELPAVTYLLFWFLSQVLSGTIAGLTASDVGGIAFWAHVGGFVAGVLFHRLFLLPEPQRPRRFWRDEYGIEGAWRNWP